MSETAEPAWESDDCVRRTVVLPIVLAERLAARAELRGAASPPQRRHHRANLSVSTIWQANTARPSSSRCPTTCRPSSSSRQNEPRSGRTKVA